MTMRLQRFLAQAGIASRRKAEELIAAGSVRVNGAVVRELGTVVDTAHDRVEYGGRVLALATSYAYYVLHKPYGVMTTMRDPEGRRTVADLMRGAGVARRVVPVGRLDYDTAGVLLLTDDGELAHVLTHPRYGVEKTYRTTIRGRLTPEQVKALREGVRLDDGTAAPAGLHVISTNRMYAVIDITIHEGKNRQVRRMFETLGHRVEALTRLRFGPVALGDLPAGAVRAATEKEVRELLGIRRAAESAGTA
jgi:23S rRNA pseudouridine2605 synthase